MRRVAATLGLALSVGFSALACSGPDHRSAWEGDRTLAESAELLRVTQVRTGIDYAWQRKRFHVLARLMTDDVVLVPPGEPALVGRQEALEWLAGWTDPLALRDTYMTESVKVGTSFAVETWTIDRQVVEASGESHRMRLQGVSLYRRQEDGRYLLARRMWNFGPPHEAGKELR